MDKVAHDTKKGLFWQTFIPITSEIIQITENYLGHFSFRPFEQEAVVVHFDIFINTRKKTENVLNIV